MCIEETLIIWNGTYYLSTFPSIIVSWPVQSWYNFKKKKKALKGTEKCDCLFSVGITFKLLLGFCFFAGKKIPKQYNGKYYVFRLRSVIYCRYSQEACSPQTYRMPSL